jgi:hypothetical protein
VADVTELEDAVIVGVDRRENWLAIDLSHRDGRNIRITAIGMRSEEAEYFVGRNVDLRCIGRWKVSGDSIFARCVG